MSKQLIALITGGGSGIGRATAIKFSEIGYLCAVADINFSSAQETVALLKTSGNIAIQVDVGNSESVQAMISKTVDQFGNINVAFNNAGVEGKKSCLADYPEEVFDTVINVNLKGVWLCMKYEIAQMMKQEPIIIDQSKWTNTPDFCKFRGSRGSIVNTSSTAGLGGMPEFSPYCISKWGILGLTKSAAQEYGKYAIRINAICPATTNTSMRDRFQQSWPDWQSATDASYPVGRVATPEEVAESVCWLAGQSCPFISGEHIKIGGGR